MSAHNLWSGSLAQKARLFSGLILFVFAAAHFVNHALGLISLDAMQAFDDWRRWIDRSWAGSLVLAAALLVHAGLAAQRLLGRRSLRLPPWEWTQIALGFAIPVLLLPHIVNTRVASQLFDVQDTYAYELARIWPAQYLQQAILLVVVWVHGCIGLHFWLRQVRLYQRLTPGLFAVAVLLPFAALAGVSVQARMIAAEITQPDRLAALRIATHWPSGDHAATIVTLRDGTQRTYLAILAVLAVALTLGLALTQRSKRIMIQYVGGPLVRTEPGPSLLEISRRHNIPHLAVCGGRGRCSTCRVLVLEGEHLPPCSDAERKTLKIIGAAANVRLACQLRPTHALTVMPLVKAKQARRNIRLTPDVEAGGIERDLAVLFVDMRGFTALTESRLPFDVIYILNQFFGTVGGPIHDNGGWITNYAGDGLIALFGDPGGLDATCRSALLAAAGIDHALTALNERLAGEMRQPLRVAMGLHAGPHVLGRVGYGEKPAMSVIGLAVNVASWLETMAKMMGVQLAVSQTAARRGGLDTKDLRSELTAVRGLSAPIDVVFVEAARQLLPRLDKRLPATPT